VENNIAYAKYLLSNGQEKEAMSICDDIDTEFRESLTSTNEVDILSIRSNAYRKSEKWQQLAETQHALTNVLSGKVAQLNEQMAQLVTNDVQQAAKQQEQLVNGKVFENLGAINTIGQTIASSEHLTQALPEIYELVKGVFPVYEFGIALYDKQDDRLDYNYFFDENGYITPISVICSNQDAIGSYVVMTQKTVHLNSATYETISTFINANKHFNDDAIKNEMETISLIIAPIMLGKEVMGILSIQSNQGDQYHTYHKRLFEQLANFIAIALNNLKQKEHLLIANQQLKKLSITDPLTGLQNRSQLNEIYRKLRSESVRGNETLSFILIDIDNYKQFNDDYGHNVGDKALVTLAKILKNVFVHESTNLFRYGGDEFLILLRGVTTVELEQRLQRLNLEISTVDIANGKQEFTLSIGAVSSFVDQDTTFRTLFDKADEALYEVKSNGRNHFKLITP
jgi:diguanylate cyclase (GGDEF)-like protein